MPVNPADETVGPVPGPRADELVTSLWGRAVTNRTVARYRTTAERDAQGVPVDGAVCWVDATDVTYHGLGGTWVPVMFVAVSGPGPALALRSPSNEDSSLVLQLGPNGLPQVRLFVGPTAGVRHTGPDLYVSAGRGSSGVLGYETFELVTFLRRLLVNIAPAGPRSLDQPILFRTTAVGAATGLGFHTVGNATGASFVFAGGANRFECRNDPGTGFVSIRATSFLTTGSTRAEHDAVLDVSPRAYDQATEADPECLDLTRVVLDLARTVKSLRRRLRALEGPALDPEGFTAMTDTAPDPYLDPDPEHEPDADLGETVDDDDDGDDDADPVEPEDVTG